MPRVKTARPYDSRGRAEQAEHTRQGIIDVARRELLAGGYATTTIAAIAREAGVSVETIYKGFGGKPGLVRAIYESGLAARRPVPAYQRSDEMKARETDPRVIIRNWGKLAAEVSPLVSPILLLVRAAAETDPDLRALLEESDAQRLTRMRKNARSLKDRGFLRSGVSVEKAADIMWMQTSPDLYELLVVRRGWSAKELGDFIASTLIAALLVP